MLFAIWNRLVKEAEVILQTKTWPDTTGTILSQRMGIQYKAYITPSQCAKHIPVVVLNGRACVTYLIDAIKTIDPTVLAAVAAAHQDDNNKRVHFENAFAYLVPAFPIAAKAAKKRKVTFNVNVSAAGGKINGGLGGGNKKPRRGTTGVSLCYHKHKKFLLLPKEQNYELSKWTEANGENANGKGNGKCSPGSNPCNTDHSVKKFKSC